MGVESYPGNILNSSNARSVVVTWFTLQQIERPENDAIYAMTVLQPPE